MRYFCCALSSPAEVTSVVPAGDREDGTRAFVFTKDGSMMKLQSSAPWDAGLSLSQPTPVRVVAPPAEVAAAADLPPLAIRYACWDAFSGCVYAAVGKAVMRVSEDGHATVIKGHLDHMGEIYECLCLRGIWSDGEGCLYVLRLSISSQHILDKLQLPALWCSMPPSGATNGAAPSSGCSNEGAQQQQQGQQQADTEVQVSSSPIDDFVGLAVDPTSRNMVVCSETAVYRIQKPGAVRSEEGLQTGPAGAGTQQGARAGAGAGLVAAAANVPAMVAGSEGTSEYADGVGSVARFSKFAGIAVDGEGIAWVLDSYCETEPDEADGGGDMRACSCTRLRRVDLSTGEVTTIDAAPLTWNRHSFNSITVLANGCLVLSDGSCTVTLLQLGLRPPWAGPGLITGPSYTLAADLGALLERQPDGSADVEVEVGGQVFAAHRSVLAARSPYFRQRLDPGAGFADAGAARLSLPDADPHAFAAVLRYLYTDSAGPLAHDLLQPVGELADRLLLPGLCAQVGRQLLGRVGLENVVGLLLWAEQRAGSYGALLGGLKEWFLRHHSPDQGRVMPDGEVMRLMRESPGLALQLLYHRRVDGR